MDEHFIILMVVIQEKVSLVVLVQYLSISYMNLFDKGNESLLMHVLWPSVKNNPRSISNLKRCMAQLGYPSITFISCCTVDCEKGKAQP